MTVKCDAMVEAASTATSLPAPESCNQAIMEGEHPSVKTIEFLRARLLSERASSKAAREQAQQIADKVKDLQAQLEREIEQRRKAETSIRKIFAILKAKGLAIHGLALALDENGLTKLAVIKEAVEEEPSVDKQEVSGFNALPPAVHRQEVPLLEEDKRVSAELSKEGMVNQGAHGTDDTHEEANVHCNMENASNCTEDASNALVTKGNSSIQYRFHVEEDEMKYAVSSKPPNCASNSDEDTSRVTDSEFEMTHKLKVMLHQMEEELHALPMEQQPLKAELQHWVDSVVGVLDNGGKDMCGQQLPDPRDNVKTGESNRPQERLTDLDTNKEHNKEVNARDDTRSSAIPMMPRNLDHLSHSFNGNHHHIMAYPLFDPLQRPATTLHGRRQSCDSFNTVSPNMPSMQWHKQASLARNTSAYSSFSPNNGYHTYGQVTGADHGIHGQITGAESPYFIDAQSPKSYVGPSSAKVQYDQGQWCDGSSLGSRVSSFRSRGKFGEETLQGHLSSTFVNDAIENPCIFKQDHHFRRVNSSLEKRVGYHQSTYTNQAGRVPREEDASRLPNCHLNDAMLSLVDENNGRLGQVLTTLDAVWQQRVNGEDQFVASPTPTLQADPRSSSVHHGGDGTWQPWPRDHYSHLRRARAHSQAAPIVQFPPSPSSEHGYSPFHRHERHRRSSSVATDFMMSDWWDGCPLQSARGGEVQLGNGITLYTD